MSTAETQRYLEHVLDKMKREPGKSPFDEMVIDFLDEVAELLKTGRDSGERK